jgi:hypothetical protein
MDRLCWVHFQISGSITFFPLQQVSIVSSRKSLETELATLLRTGSLRWGDLDVTPCEFVETCVAEDLTGLVRVQLEAWQEADWPLEIREALTARARADTARELVYRQEIGVVLNALATEHVYPILFKGTPLAYDVYPAPHLRPRSDTDFLISPSHIRATRALLESLGYTPTVYCDGELLFRQFELSKKGAFGVDHVFDVHWKISTQSLFADLLTYDELVSDARPIPALGPHARTVGRVHALLLACLHPVMHHRNTQRLIWLYDVHLLVSQLSPTELSRFVDLATRKRVRTICRDILTGARERFGTPVPEWVTRRLDEVPHDEPTAVYLERNRRWHHELSSNLRSLGWRDRMRLLREVFLPTPDYMQQSYGFAPGSVSSLLLPMLYIHRALRGGVNVLTGRK